LRSSPPIRLNTPPWHGAERDQGKVETGFPTDRATTKNLEQAAGKFVSV
jgi:hypothetical protein